MQRPASPEAAAASNPPGLTGCPSKKTRNAGIICTAAALVQHPRDVPFGMGSVAERDGCAQTVIGPEARLGDLTLLDFLLETGVAR